MGQRAVTSGHIVYFAYGSNMLTRRITAAARAPTARPLGPGYLEGRRLTFDKVGRDHSGKCTVEATGRNDDRVYGVLFEIAPTEKPALDAAEGLGRGYREDSVHVVTDSGPVRATTYIATHTEPGLRPYHWYRAMVIAGALEHGLPRPYVERLRAFGSIEDPHAERRAKNEALLFGSPTQRDQPGDSR